ncbi:GNAT family N-acetyltransferase [Wansuia hejianensis]|uniref:GNAT family N-acetyltransferase n=1 Tax=Wansuia hejianensis TaxID=2763667 RepID=A0A926EWW5_9FIRM|nr:GNAT family protein [Wansuia hejianensis]MBC8591363.1 GNAT family N-acetyltransferase [Wansuia hejianensis]
MYRLTGERIILREYRREDLVHMRKWVNDYDITKYLSNLFLYPHSISDTENFLNAMIEGNSNMKGFIIAHKGTEEYIGQLDLIKIDWLNRVGTIGIVIGTKENLGKGYGTEAIKLLQGFAFNELNLNKLELEVRDYNKRAISCYKKCGFIEEGIIRENYYIDGKYTDTIRMGVLKKEWKSV